MKFFFDWIINRFTYIQIYFFICLTFLISLFPIVFFWIKTHHEQLRTLDSQIYALQQNEALMNAFYLLEEHRLLTLRYYSEPHNKDMLQRVRTLEDQIQQYIATLDQSITSDTQQFTHETILWRKVFPKEIQREWREIVEGFTTFSQRENESLQTALLHDINILFDYLLSRIGISYFEETKHLFFAQHNHYVFIQSLFLRLPYFQENVAQLLLTSEKILTHSSKEISRDRSQALIDLIKPDIQYFEMVLNAYATFNHLSAEQKNPLNSLKEYLTLVNHFIQTVETRILHPSDPTIHLIDFVEETQHILTLGTQTWQHSLDDLIQIFKMERKFIAFRLWAILSATFLLAGFAFFLGLSLIYTGILRLSQLTQATHNFTNGDLSVRIPDHYTDDIGRQAQAFNHMAQKLEALINHLYELIDATRVLANGNLQARIPLRQDHSEFDQVAVSFNKMAETFETIICRLQQMGRMLTSSASEMTAASKEQEATIVEQEATTREIALAANEISSTAKELAHTMNEVSQAAEKTSSLALKGKDSLNNMESVMHNMVEASSKIADKLAVLNEKAGNITSVITTITKVADQTNLLSLNASIEAEKAGEHGRSFAVIAREIRRLADQSAIATLDVEKMVHEIITAVSSSVKGVDDFTQEIQQGVEQARLVSEHLATIIAQVQAFTTRFEFVNQGMQAQSAGAEQINEAIIQLSQTARQTTEAIHQFHKTVEELNRAANDLSTLNPFA